MWCDPHGCSFIHWLALRLNLSAVIAAVLGQALDRRSVLLGNFLSTSLRGCSGLRPYEASITNTSGVATSGDSISFRREHLAIYTHHRARLLHFSCEAMIA